MSEPTEPNATPSPDPPAAQPPRPSPSPRALPAVDSRTKRLLNVPVSVSVRLAEKRVELESVLSLVPGSIITFNKSCEELLDLYVNNHRFARGEAVKIGEKFGLRLTQVGVKPVRIPRIING